MYKEKVSKAKKAVVIAKARAYEHLYAKFKQKKVKRSCTYWQGRETEQETMYST